MPETPRSAVNAAFFFRVAKSVESDALVADHEVREETNVGANGTEAGQCGRWNLGANADAADGNINPVLAARFKYALDAGNHH